MTGKRPKRETEVQMPAPEDIQTPASEIDPTDSPGSDDAPTVPDGLGDAGRALWAAILAGLEEASEDDQGGWELDERELAILEAAARQADDLGKIEAAIEEHGVMTRGSTNQLVVNPAVAEARQSRAALAKLLGQLKLPTEEQAPTLFDAKSLRGQRAANTRWGNR